MPNIAYFTDLIAEKRFYMDSAAITPNLSIFSLIRGEDGKEDVINVFPFANSYRFIKKKGKEVRFSSLKMEPEIKLTATNADKHEDWRFNSPNERIIATGCIRINPMRHTEKDVFKMLRTLVKATCNGDLPIGDSLSVGNIDYHYRRVKLRKAEKRHVTFCPDTEGVYVTLYGKKVYRTINEYRKELGIEELPEYDINDDGVAIPFTVRAYAYSIPDGGSDPILNKAETCINDIGVLLDHKYTKEMTPVNLPYI